MDQVGSILERPKRYYNVDGVGELGGGFMLLSFGFIQWMQVRSPAHSAWHSMWVFCIYFGSMFAIVHYGTKAIKEHITYPRTGFVEYRKRDRVWPNIFAAVAAPAFLALIILALRRHWDLTTGATLVGLLSAASYAYHFAREVRWKWAVAWAMAIGSILIAILPGDLIGALTGHSWLAVCLPSFMLYGPLLLISGGISFWLYLRHTEVPARDAQ
jgi:hypothetical protein